MHQHAGLFLFAPSLVYDVVEELIVAPHAHFMMASASAYFGICCDSVFRCTNIHCFSGNVLYKFCLSYPKPYLFMVLLC